MPDEAPDAEQMRQRKLKGLLAQYQTRRKAGQPVDQQALLRAFPEFRKELLSWFACDASDQELDAAFVSTRLQQQAARPSHGETLGSGVRHTDTASEFTARMFGRYQLLRPLGEGAMGQVYLALDTVLDRRVALKMPRAAPADAHEFLARFTREAKAAAGLNHAHICRVYDAGEVNGTAFITMDFIEGVPLARLIGTPSLQSVEHVLKIARIIADAVRHAHDKGVIHRDLKPGNILMDEHQNPFVTDFGLARRLVPTDATRVTQEGLLVGTPAYMAPEQVRGTQKEVGVTSDIYSFGVVLFEMLTGRLPFDGTLPELLAKVLRDRPPIPSRLRPELSEDVDDIVLKMLQKNAAHRFSSMDEVIVALVRLEEKWKATSAASENARATSALPAPGASSFDTMKSHIEVMLQKGQYTTALRDLEKLAAQQSPRARDAAAWARKKLPEVRSEARAMNPAGLAALLQTAQQLFGKHDYQGCLQLLDDIPPLRRTEAMEELRTKAQQLETQAEQLLDDIRDRERRQVAEGLESLVRRLLRLKPGNSYARKLLLALQSYGPASGTRPRYRFERGRLQPMPERSLLGEWGMKALLTGIFVFLIAYSYVTRFLNSDPQSPERMPNSAADAPGLAGTGIGGQAGERGGRADGPHGAAEDNAQAADGWTYLFSGRQAAGWASLGPFQIRDELLIGTDGRGMAVSADEFDDFELEAEWRLRGADTNGGIFYREDAATPTLMEGNEYQIIDPAHPAIQSPTHRTAAFYGVAAPSADVQRPAGEWNTTRIVCRGEEVEHWLNGERVVHFVSSSPEWKQLVDASSRRGDKSKVGTASRGHVLLQSQKGELAFRQIRIRRDQEHAPLVAPVTHHSLQLPDGAVYFDHEDFRAIQSGSVAEILSWSSALPKKYCPLWSSVRANSHEARFDVVAVPHPDITDWKLAVVDAEGSAFEQPALKGWQALSINSFSEAGQARSLCVVTNGRRPWQFWVGGEPFIQQKIDQNAKMMSHINSDYWPSLPVFLTSNHVNNPGSYFLLAMPAPPLREGRFVASQTQSELVSLLETARQNDRRPHLISFDRISNGQPTFLTVLRDNPERTRPSEISSPEWSYSLGISQDEFIRLLKRVAPMGGSPQSPFSFIWDNRLHYSVIWNGVSAEQLESLRNGNSSSVTRSPPQIAAKPVEAVPAVAPFDGPTALKLQQAWSEHLKVPLEYTNSVGMKFRLIPPGTFTIGSTRQEIDAARPGLHTAYEQSRLDRADSEAPAQRITLTRPYYIGVTEVTQSQYEQVMGTNPSEFCRSGGRADVVAGQDRSAAPAENMTWISTGEFCERLTAHEGLTSAYHNTGQMISQTGTGGYRLPTEAEWEFACRSGTTTLFCTGDDEESLASVAWFGGNNSTGAPHAVGTRKPNAFGLFDMHGNVWEWVHDAWRPDTYQLMQGTGAIDPRCDLGAEYRRVIRGGDFFMSAAEARSACRDAYALDSSWYDVGFRVALSVDAIRQLLLNTPSPAR